MYPLITGQAQPEASSSSLYSTTCKETTDLFLFSNIMTPSKQTKKATQHKQYDVTHTSKLTKTFYFILEVSLFF